jgi:hypothetical protein
MDTLLGGVWTNLLYFGEGRTVEVLNRPSVEPVPDSPDFKPTLYPNQGGWPRYLRRNASHLFQSKSLTTYDGDYAVLYGDPISQLGEIICMPANTTHRGIAPDEEEERFCLFWPSYSQKVSCFFYTFFFFFFLFIF